ncbi:hypothetical protein NDU88_002798 [Pleurodeles waltl]|uniref:Uncharacterized protein n=1 Tax=Pleurodeles waltl TaxID=8319 RepID=A0AAV7WPL9_PLEWA|nr:hypothetical protein NDU88_002798 [Pleurodeles waltl]
MGYAGSGGSSAAAPALFPGFLPRHFQTAERWSPVSRGGRRSGLLMLQAAAVSGSGAVEAGIGGSASPQEAARSGAHSINQ